MVRTIKLKLGNKIQRTESNIDKIKSFLMKIKNSIFPIRTDIDKYIILIINDLIYFHNNYTKLKNNNKLNTTNITKKSHTIYKKITKTKSKNRFSRLKKLFTRKNKKNEAGHVRYLNNEPDIRKITNSSLTKSPSYQLSYKKIPLFYNYDTINQNTNITHNNELLHTYTNDIKYSNNSKINKLNSLYSKIYDNISLCIDMENGLPTLDETLINSIKKYLTLLQPMNIIIIKNILHNQINDVDFNNIYICLIYIIYELYTNLNKNLKKYVGQMNKYLNSPEYKKSMTDLYNDISFSKHIIESTQNIVNSFEGNKNIKQISLNINRLIKQKNKVHKQILKILKKYIKNKVIIINFDEYNILCSSNYDRIINNENDYNHTNVSYSRSSNISSNISSSGRTLKRTRSIPNLSNSRHTTHNNTLHHTQTTNISLASNYSPGTQNKPNVGNNTTLQYYLNNEHKIVNISELLQKLQVNKDIANNNNIPILSHLFKWIGNHYVKHILNKEVSKKYHESKNKSINKQIKETEGIIKDAIKHNNIKLYKLNKLFLHNNVKIKYGEKYIICVNISQVNELLYIEYVSINKINSKKNLNIYNTFNNYSINVNIKKLHILD